MCIKIVVIQAATYYKISILLKNGENYVRENEINYCRAVKYRRFRDHFGVKDDLNADSLDLFEMVMALEDNYGVEIPSEDLEKLLTVGDVVNYLKDKGVDNL